MANFLESRGWLGSGEQEKLQEEMADELNRVIEATEKMPLPAVDTLIDDVFEEPTWRLREDLAEWFGKGQ